MGLRTFHLELRHRECPLRPRRVSTAPDRPDPKRDTSDVPSDIPGRRPRGYVADPSPCEPLTTQWSDTKDSVYTKPCITITCRQALPKVESPPIVRKIHPVERPRSIMLEHSVITILRIKCLSFWLKISPLVRRVRRFVPTLRPKGRGREWTEVSVRDLVILHRV